MQCIIYSKIKTEKFNPAAVVRHWIFFYNCSYDGF